MKIFCFGNPYVEEDNAALKLADIFSASTADKKAGKPLVGFEFIKCETPDYLLDFEGETIFILDVVRGIKEVSIIDDIAKLEPHSLVSLHDFDLCFFLKLIQAAGQVRNIKIIGIPYCRKASEVKDEVTKKLKRCCS